MIQIGKPGARLLTAALVALLPLMASTCGSSDAPSPTPAPVVVPSTYTLRYSLTPTGSQASGYVFFDVEPFFEVDNTYGPNDFHQETRQYIPPGATQTHAFATNLPRGKKVRITAGFYEPFRQPPAINTGYPIRPGDKMTVDLLGDNAVSGTASITYDEASAGVAPVVTSRLLFNGSPYIEAVDKSVELTLP